MTSADATASTAARTPDTDPGVLPALIGLLRRVAEATTAGDVLAALVDTVVATTDATGAAVLERNDTNGRVEVTAHYGVGLPDDQVSLAALWASTGSELPMTWSGLAAVPPPLRGRAEWTAGLVMELGVEEPPSRVLLIAGGNVAEGLGTYGDLAMAVTPALDALRQHQRMARTRNLLDRVTELAARLTRAGTVAGLILALVEEVADLEVVTATVVWRLVADTDADRLVAEAEAGPGLSLLQHGMDDEVEQRIRGVLAHGTSRAGRAMLAAPAPLADGRLLTLLPIGVEPRRVLGLLHDRLLDPEVHGVLSTLVGALGPALVNAGLATERRTLLGTFSRTLRPGRVPAATDIGVEHHPNTTAAESFGGDFFDWFEPDAHRVLLALGDVAGKGVPAAAAASMAVWSLRALGRQGTGPNVLARLLDTAVAEELGGERFVTLALLDIDTTTWRVRMVLAGHPAPLLLRHTTPPEELELHADRPLGVMPLGPAFTTHERQLEPGDALVLFTDGATEAQAPDGERLGRDRLRAAAQAAWAPGSVRASELAGALWSAVHAWSGGPPDDDCALIVLRRP